MTYFNTTHVLGKEFDSYETKAKCQEETILRFFLERYPQEYTASEIWRFCFNGTRWDCNVPITSARRAITNLYNAGDLAKTDKQQGGIFGRPEYLWKISTQHLQGDLFS